MHVCVRVSPGRSGEKARHRRAALLGQARRWRCCAPPHASGASTRAIHSRCWSATRSMPSHLAYSWISSSEGSKSSGMSSSITTDMASSCAHAGACVERAPPHVSQTHAAARDTRTPPLHGGNPHTGARARSRAGTRQRPSCCPPFCRSGPALR